MKAVTVVDHGLGNLFNLVTALRVIGATVKHTQDPDTVRSAERLVVPGVGAFEPGAATLREKGLDAAIRDFRRSGRPLLGICLGMQLFMTESEENGQHQGFDFISGRVEKFPPGSVGAWRVPQIGWNTVIASDDHQTNQLLHEIPKLANMYFVHSYYVSTASPMDTVAYTDYAERRYSSIVAHENVLGVQFHPERSAAHGLKLLANFAAM